MVLQAEVHGIRRFMAALVGLAGVLGICMACHPAEGTSASVPADTTRPAYEAAALERAIHERVNEVRRREGLSGLAWADSLRPLGRVHSRDMAERDYFAHVSPDGGDVNERANRLGLMCERQVSARERMHGFGENLYSAHLYHWYRDTKRGDTVVNRTYNWKSPDTIAEEVVDGWMKSPGHRKNLLDPRYQTEAIGLHLIGDRYFVTQVFC